MKIVRPQDLFFYLKVFLFSFFLLLFVPPDAHSGDWRVSPIRLDFGRDSKTGVLTVSNDADQKLQLQMKAFEWTQDAEGKDHYKETNDIIFFPKIMVHEKKEEKILRAGIKIPAVLTEKTYRLFIEEIPDPKRATQGVQVAIAIRFGVPIFVRPLKEEPKGEIVKFQMSKAAVSAVISNTGNVSFQIRNIKIRGKNLKGEEIFSEDLTGWYLLSGSKRLYTAQLPREICSNIVKLSIEVMTDKITLNGNLDADSAMCIP